MLMSKKDLESFGELPNEQVKYHDYIRILYISRTLMGKDQRVLLDTAFVSIRKETSIVRE